MAKATYQPVFRFLNDKGEEVPDPQPVAVPIGFKEPESLQDQIRRLIAVEGISALAAAQGEETFEESEDFEIDDDMFDPSSPYEEVYDPVMGRGITYEEWKQNEPVYRERFLQAEQRAYAELDRSNALRAIPRPHADRGAGVSPAQSSKGKVKENPPDEAT